VVPVEAAREPHGQGTVKVVGVLDYNLPERSAAPSPGRLQRFGKHQSGLGREVSGSVVCPHHAEQDRADEEDRSQLAEHRTLIQLDSGQRTVSAGSVEGLNTKAKLTIRKAYGFSHLPRH